MTLRNDLLNAVARRDYARAEKCLRAGIDPTVLLEQAGYVSAIYAAVLNDDAKMLTLFHQYGANLYKPTHFFQQKTVGNALTDAIINGKTAAADAILEIGFDILHPDLDLQMRPWYFPLHAAIQYDKLPYALRILETLQDAQCLHDFDILSTAGKRGHLDVLAATISRARDLGNPFTVDELTHAARNTICEGGLAAFEYLLRAGADPNRFFTIKNRQHDFTSGFTLMHYTIGSSLEDRYADEFLYCLLKHGGDASIKTSGDPPMNSFEFAAQRGRNTSVLSKAKALLEEFLIARVQPAIDKIYTGGDKPLPLPTRRRMP